MSERKRAGEKDGNPCPADEDTWKIETLPNQGKTMIPTSEAEPSHHLIGPPTSVAAVYKDFLTAPHSPPDSHG
jgi:hypothetical protein